MAWFVKIERGIVDKRIFDQFVPAHRQFVLDLVNQGISARTGYWRDSAGGMLLFQADSLDSAKQLIEQDPLIQNHCVDYELHEWVLVEGPPLS